MRDDSNANRNQQGNTGRGNVDVQSTRAGRGREGRQNMPSLFNTFFGNDFPGMLNWDMPSVLNRMSRNIPAVNIRERKDDYVIDVAAPGMRKEDFRINIEGDTLQISAERSYERNEEEENYTRREFEQSSFNRYFTLPDSADPEKIEAKYTDGVLCIIVPKREEAKSKQPRQVRIS